MDPAPRFHFGPFELDPDADVLFRHGAPVTLRPQAARLLRYLVERAGRVITKRELLENVWQGVVTTEGVLKTTLSQVRQALGDDADRERFIRTFHRRGYQFVAAVRTDAHRAAPQARVASLSPAPTVDDTILVGRAAALAALQAEFGASLEGRASPVLLAGDAGAGKTLLARHFLTWAGDQGARALYTRFFDYSASRLAPFEIFVDLLRSALEEVDDGEDGDLASLLRSQGGQALVDALRKPPDPTLASSVRPRTALQNEFRAIGPLSRAFVRLSRARPIVLALDDLQWSSDADRDLLAHLITSSQGERLLVLAIVRAEDLRDEASDVVRWLRRRGASRAFVDVTLPVWTERECEAAVRGALGAAAEAPLPLDPADVFRLSGGNPYFVMELLRSVTAGAEGRRTRGPRVTDPLVLPPTIALASADRLDRLPAGVRALVDRAAVLGDEFRAATLAEVAGLPIEAVDHELQEAVRHSVLSTQLVSAGEDYRFYHTLLRRVAYDRLAPRVRRELHKRAARALCRAYADQLDRVATAISAHYDAADLPRETLTWSLHGWRAARARWRWPDAIVSIERAERAAARLAEEGAAVPPEDAVSLRFGLGERDVLQGNLNRAADVLHQAAAEASRTGQRALLAAIRLQSAATLAGLSVYDASMEAADDAWRISSASGDREGADQATIQWAAACIALGNHQQAAPRLTALLADDRVSRPVATAAALMVGWMRALQGQPAEAERLLERARRGYEEINDTRGHALTLRRLHWVALARGDYQRAYTLAHQARLEYRGVDDAVGEAKLQMGMGQARLGQGLFQEGLELLTATCESMQDIGDAHCEAETRWLMGRACLGLGQLDRARALLDDALERVRRIKDRDDEFRVQVDRAAALRAVGALPDALAAADDAVAGASDLASIDGEGAARIERSLTWLALGRTDAAVEEARRAVELTEASASGARWRAQWALGKALLASGPAGRTSALAHLQNAVSLAHAIRAQLDPDNQPRWRLASQAFSGPERDLEEARRQQN